MRPGTKELHSSKRQTATMVHWQPKENEFSKTKQNFEVRVTCHRNSKQESVEKFC